VKGTGGGGGFVFVVVLWDGRPVWGKAPCRTWAAFTVSVESVESCGIVCNFQMPGGDQSASGTPSGEGKHMTSYICGIGVMLCTENSVHRKIPQEIH